MLSGTIPLQNATGPTYVLIYIIYSALFKSLPIGKGQTYSNYIFLLLTGNVTHYTFALYSLLISLCSNMPPCPFFYFYVYVCACVNQSQFINGIPDQVILVYAWPRLTSFWTILLDQPF